MPQSHQIKTPGGRRKPVDFDEMMLIQSPVTYERNLLAALIHSHKLFLATNGSLCPWDDVRAIHRPDFSISHYNILYEAISTYWSSLGSGAVSNDPIPKAQLDAILIDWANSGRVDGGTIEKLVEEVNSDMYSMDLTPEFIEHSVMGKVFDYWLSLRLSHRFKDEFDSKSKQKALTLENCQAMLDHYEGIFATSGSKIRTAALPRDRTMWEMVNSIDVEDDPGELLKTRYLGRWGGLLLVGPTGIGKSTIAMQCSVQWGLGNPAFGIEPNGSLKSLIIQSENDDVDMLEMFNGVCDALAMEDSGRRTAGENIVVVREDATAGPEFFTKVVRPMVEKHRPDLLWIDPALAYLGGESNNQRDVGNFLRTLLNPLIREFNCGAIVLHHTNKPPSGKDVSTWSNSEFAYAGGGSAEWANWARAVLVLKPVRDSGVFELMAAKRGGRLGWMAPDGKTRAYNRYIAHSKVPGQLYWREADPTEIPEPGDPKEKDDIIVMELVPEVEEIGKNKLLEDCSNNDVPNRRARDAIKRLVTAGKIKETLYPRTIGQGEKRIIRVPQPQEEANAADKKE